MIRCAIVLAALMTAPAALACSLAPQPSYVVDTESTDTTAPDPAEVVAVEIGRGTGPRGGLFWSSSTSCDDLGFLTLVVEGSDDESALEEMGFLVELDEGSLPDGLGLDSEPVGLHLEGDASGSIVFAWIDGATDRQEPFEATLRVTPFDAAGNEGEPAFADVSDPGGRGGCSHLPGGPGGWFAGLALLAVRRRVGSRAVST